MAKKINIEIKDIEKLEFTLKTDATKGDYISLSEVGEISFDSVKNELKENKQKLINKIWEENKATTLANSIEYKNLEKKIQSFEIEKLKIKSDLEKENKNLESKLEKEFLNEKQELNKEISELESKLKVIENSTQSKINEEITKVKSSKDLEIEKLNNLIEKLTDKLDQLNLKNSEQKESLNERIESLKNQSAEKIEQLKEKLESEKENLTIKIENQLTKEFNAKISELNKELGQKESELKSVEKNSELEIKNSILTKEKEIEEKYIQIIKEKEEEIKLKEEEINKMEMRRNLLNIKEIGEDLERWMTSEASNYLSLPNVVHRKANTIVDGTKPDFIFEILNDDKSILTSVTIEAKSEALKGVSTKKKNIDHIAKLDSDRKKNQSEYAILVTELEKEDDFIFKKVGEYENMYMVRPRYYIPLLQLIYNLSIKKNEINELQINFKEKQEILIEFNNFKNDILETTMLKIQANFEEIDSEANKVIKSAEKIISKTRTADGHLRTLEKKFKNFKIEKLTEKI